MLNPGRSREDPAGASDAIGGVLRRFPSAKGRARPAVASDRTALSRTALFSMIAIAAAGGGFILNGYWLRTLTGMFMTATVAQSINIIAGFTGCAAFGQVVFFGLGGYATAVAMTLHGMPFLAGAVLGMLVCAAFAIACGIPLFRLKGHYFAIATLGLNEAAEAVVDNWSGLTGGGSGLSLPLPPGGLAGAARLFYLAFLVLMLGATGAVWLLGHTRFGYACRAIRADEDTAAATGINPLVYKTAAWVLSALFIGLAGSLYVYWQSYIDPPTAFDLDISVKGFVVFLLGGPGSVLGPIVAAFAFELISTLVWSHVLTFHLGIMGILIMLSVLSLPYWATWSERRRSWVIRLLAFTRAATKP